MTALHYATCGLARAGTQVSAHALAGALEFSSDAALRGCHRRALRRLPTTYPHIDTVIVGAGYPVEYLGRLRRSWAVATPALREWIGTRMECIDAFHGPSAMLYGQDRIADVANIGQRTRMQEQDVRSAHKAVV